MLTFLNFAIFRHFGDFLKRWKVLITALHFSRKSSQRKFYLMTESFASMENYHDIVSIITIIIRTRITTYFTGQGQDGFQFRISRPKVFCKKGLIKILHLQYLCWNPILLKLRD